MIMLVHSPSPPRFQYAEADFDAFVAEHCAMISLLVNRLRNGEPRKAEDGPSWSASAIELTNSSSRTAARPRFPASPPDGSTACCPRRSAIPLFIVRKSRLIRFACFRTLAASSLFLVCYIWYRPHHGVTRFPRTRCAARPLPSAARFAHNSGGGHRALGVDVATPGLARMVRAPQENRSLDTPSLVLRLCYLRCGLLGVVSLAPVGKRGCPATH